MSMRLLKLQDEFNGLMSSDNSRLFIVKMGAEWCWSCVEFQLEFEKLAQHLRATERDAECILVDKSEDTECLFEKYEISKLPTVLLVLGDTVQKSLLRPTFEELLAEVCKHLPDRKLVLDEDF